MPLDYDIDDNPSWSPRNHETCRRGEHHGTLEISAESRTAGTKVDCGRVGLGRHESRLSSEASPAISEGLA